MVEKNDDDDDDDVVERNEMKHFENLCVHFFQHLNSSLSIF
jgi:hypothetical protein